MPHYLPLLIIDKLLESAKRALGDLLAKTLYGIMSIIFNVVEGAINKITDAFLRPLDMDISTFKTVFPFLTRLYKWVLWFGVGLATVILLFQLFKTIFLKDGGEHPVRLLGRTALTIIVMFSSTFLFDAALSFAKVPYTAMLKERDKYDFDQTANDVYNLIDGNMTREEAEKLLKEKEAEYNALKAAMEENPILETKENKQTLTELWIEIAKLKTKLGIANTAGNISPSSSGYVSGSVLTYGSAKLADDFLGDGDEEIDARVDDNGNIIGDVVGYVTYGILAFLLGLIFMIFIAWNYLKLVLECIERYVVLGVLYMTAPIPLAAGVAEETKPILKSWVRMCVSQILILFFSMWFLNGFGHIFTSVALNSSKDPGHAIFYLGMCLTFLKVGQHVDEYFGIVGMSAAKTGGNLLEDLALFGTLKTMTGMVAPTAKAMFGRSKGEKVPSVMDVVGGKTAPVGVTGIGGPQTQKSANAQVQRILGFGTDVKGARVLNGKVYGETTTPDGQKQKFVARKLSKADETSIKSGIGGDVRRIAVLDAGGKQVGMVSRMDLKAAKASGNPAAIVPVMDKSGKQIGTMPVKAEGGAYKAFGTDGKLIGSVSERATESGSLNLKKYKAFGTDGKPMGSVSESAAESGAFSLKKNESLVTGADGNTWIITNVPSREMIAQSKSALDGYNLDGLDASGMDLSGAFIKDCTLGGANLTGTNLKDAVLENCDVEGMDATGANVSGTEFNQVYGQMNLSGATGTETQFINSDISGTTADGMQLTESNVVGSNLSGLVGRNIKIESSTISGSNLEGLNTQDMSLENTTLKENSFNAAVMPGTNFSGVNGINNDFVNAQMPYSTFNKDTVLENSIFTGTNASYSDMRDASLIGSKAEHANFSGSDMRGTVLDYSYMPSASFYNARMDAATQIQYANLTDADFRIREGERVLMTDTDTTNILIPNNAGFSEDGSEAFISNGQRKLKRRFNLNKPSANPEDFDDDLNDNFDEEV